MLDRRLSPGAVGPPEPTLAVHYPSCLVPDTFRDIPGWEMSLSVEGTLCTSCHVFEASLVIAKCPAKYELHRDGGTSLRAARPTPLCTSNEK